MTRVLLTDVDNTLYSWIDYFAPCFRELVRAVSTATHIPEPDLYDSFRTVFRRVGTVEALDALRDAVPIQNLSEAQRSRAIRVGLNAFNRATRLHLAPYRGVRTTLNKLRAERVRIVAVTNSGVVQAIDRLHWMGIDRFLDGLVAWNGDVSGEITSQGALDKALTERMRFSRLPWTIALPSAQLKPSPVAYARAIERLRLSSATIWVVGDSVHKDLSAAAGLNAVSVWAKYGHGFGPKNFETLLRITHWSKQRIKKTYDTSALAPDHIAETFADLAWIIGDVQPALFRSEDSGAPLL